MKQHLPRELRASARTLRHLWDYWIDPVAPIAGSFAYLAAFPRFFQTWFRYRHLPGAERLRFRDSHPCLFESTDSTSYDPHYFYQAVWATERIARTGTRQHVDIGSDIDFVGMLTTQVPVVFLDIRPLTTSLPRLHCASGDILNLPFAANSVGSLSCLHVAEHIGLGRYGDALNPLGTRQACAELARVLMRNGNLFFSLPVGRPRVSFNAHRVHSPDQILEYFKALTLVEFSAVDDNGNLSINIDPRQIRNADYACGMFWFRGNHD